MDEMGPVNDECLDNFFKSYYGSERYAEIKAKLSEPPTNPDKRTLDFLNDEYWKDKSKQEAFVQLLENHMSALDEMHRYYKQFTECVITILKS
jgi:hypothetical protein